MTGGAGFIGSELVKQLVTASQKAIVVDNLVNGRRENLDRLSSDLLQLEVADIRDHERMRSLVRGVEVVFHLACTWLVAFHRGSRHLRSIKAYGTLRPCSAP